MTDTIEIAVYLLFAATGLAGLLVAAVWLTVGGWAVARRARAADARGAAGTLAVAAGAAFGTLLGMELAGTGLFALVMSVAQSNGHFIDVPDWAGLTLALSTLLIPVGLIFGPAFTLWGLVGTWRVTEAGPLDADGHPAGPVPRGTSGPEAADPLDAPFTSDAGAG